MAWSAFEGAPCVGGGVGPRPRPTRPENPSRRPTARNGGPLGFRAQVRDAKQLSRSVRNAQPPPTSQALRPDKTPSKPADFALQTLPPQRCGCPSTAQQAINWRAQSLLPNRAVARGCSVVLPSRLGGHLEQPFRASIQAFPSGCIRIQIRRQLHGESPPGGPGWRCRFWSNRTVCSGG